MPLVIDNITANFAYLMSKYNKSKGKEYQYEREQQWGNDGIDKAY